MEKLIRIDKNGTKYFEGEKNCSRCGGSGLYLDYGVCFKCGGMKTEKTKRKEYTPEHEAKLTKQREARAKKRAEKEAERIKREKAIEKEREEKANEKEREEEAKREKIRKASNYIGDIGEKMQGYVEVKKIIHIETRYGYNRLWIFESEKGNVITWFTNSYFGFEEGDKLLINGIVKEHKEYEGIKQTVMKRVKGEKVSIC